MPSNQRSRPMECHEIRRLIDADVDSELDLVRHLEMAAHLGTCPDCARYAENIRARRFALSQSLNRFRAPPELSGKISAALRTAGAPVSAAVSSPRKSLLSWPTW